MRLVRTQFAYEEVTAHLTKFGRNPLIENYFVQYLLVAFYSEVEEVIKEIISQRLARIDDNKVAYFISKTNEAMIRRLKKAEINDILQKFNCGEGDIISEYVGDMNLQPYFDAITNRHLVSHRAGSSMTLEAFANALPCAEAIMDAVEEAISPIS